MNIARLWTASSFCEFIFIYLFYIKHFMHFERIFWEILNIFDFANISLLNKSTPLMLYKLKSS